MYDTIMHKTTEILILLKLSPNHPQNTITSKKTYSLSSSNKSHYSKGSNKTQMMLK